jgi:hypothetical protein
MNRLTRAMVHRLLIFVFICVGVTSPGFTQQPNQAQINAIRQACRGDYQTYCATVPAGGSAALACLKENAQSLSAPCQKAVSAAGGSAAASRTQTPAPTAAAPAPAAPTPAAPAYQTAPAPIPPRQEAALLRRACGSDFRALCSGVRPGGGRIIECLEANSPNLSQQCRSALVSARQGR